MSGSGEERGRYACLVGMNPGDERDPCCSARHRARRGRPSSATEAERRRQVLDSLDAIYAQSGIDGLSMNEVARQAGMSKRTLYAIFGDRTALFVAYLERLKAEALRPLGPEMAGAPIEARLRALLRPVPGGPGLHLPLSLLRAIVAEVPDRPELGARLVESACIEAGQTIRAELDRAAAAGEIVAADTDALAALLLDMVRPSPLEALLAPDRVPDAAALDRRFDLALEVFLSGIRPR
jgi:AcrR family transcriptional regulator